uniref:REM-1 domain-containing protein n=1 Tax=Glossina brevipalpis TaxID=37001 RepID=A0A1A9X5Q3_9MUSC
MLKNHFFWLRTKDDIEEEVIKCYSSNYLWVIWFSFVRWLAGWLVGWLNFFTLHSSPLSSKIGSDPRAATCRGKLQTRRCKLNQEINKELRLRAGAENLYKATTNRKLRDTVALELSFVNSNLQLLKEQLAELNSSVEIYQNNRL